MTIKAVLFDFSSTLADCGPTWWELEVTSTVTASLSHLREHGLIAVGDDDLAQADELYMAMKRTAKDSGVEIPAIDAVRQALEALGLQVPDETLVRHLDDIFRACLPDVVPIPGAAETLAALQARGLALAVISNARHGAFVRWALQRLAMLDYFRSVVVSADVRLRKPRPEIFLNTLADLGVAAGEAVFVGDYYPYDMVGARAAGMQTVWLVEPNKAHDDLPADLIISRLPELVPWVDSRL